MKTSKKIIDLCRKLRKDMTPAERELWNHLRNRKLGGHKFLRQHPIVYSNASSQQDFVILDFYCVNRSLAVEVDGGIHDNRKERDDNRDKILYEMGIRTLRIRNEELQDVKSVLNKILTALYSE